MFSKHLGVSASRVRGSKTPTLTCFSGSSVNHRSRFELGSWTRARFFSHVYVQLKLPVDQRGRRTHSVCTASCFSFTHGFLGREEVIVLHLEVLDARNQVHAVPEPSAQNTSTTNQRLERSSIKRSVVARV